MLKKGIFIDLALWRGKSGFSSSDGFEKKYARSEEGKKLLRYVKGRGSEEGNMR